MSDKYAVFPSYVGSKAWWVKSGKLDFLEGKGIAEPFAGSGVISMSLASSALLNDQDEIVSKILARFDEQDATPINSEEEYMTERCREDWWKRSYVLQSLSFSGVFRYSKNGFNVPIKRKNKEAIVGRDVTEQFERDLSRWRDLGPQVTNLDYQMTAPLLSQYDVCVIDPPYDTSVAAYCNDDFDHQVLWMWIDMNWNLCHTWVIFEYDFNLPEVHMTRKMRVNGSRSGANEGVAIFERDLSFGKKAEVLFAASFPGLELMSEPHGPDFRILKTGTFLELKTDTYDMNKTPNFMIERYSDQEAKTDGGPWQALAKGSTTFAYFFIKNNVVGVFDTQQLITRCEALYDRGEISPVSVQNQGWTTLCYKVPRELTRDIVTIKRINP